MKDFAALIYHCDSLCIKIFPAGKYREIDWNTSIFSGDNFDFYAFEKDPDDKKLPPFIEYSKDDTYNIEPLRLKETIRYKCKIYSSDDSNSDKNFDIHIHNEENKFIKIDRDEDDSITFQFINYLGKSSIAFKVESEVKHLSFEVVSNKFEYKEDYVNLTEDIAEKCAALLLDYASPTSLSFISDSEKTYKTALEQFIFLRQFCYADNIESLFAAIKRNPDKALVTEDELKPFGTGVISNKFFTNPFSHSRGWNKADSGAYLPSEIAVSHKYEDFDTPANRFLKFAFNLFIEICENICNHVEESFVYHKEAQTVKNILEDILNDSFFDDVNNLTVMPINNQVLEKREGYAQIFKAFSMVDLALQIKWEGKEDVYSGDAKNTALLYEYWLVFELIEILKDKKIGAEFIQQKFNDSCDDMLYINSEGNVLVSLKEGKQSKVSFAVKEKGLRIDFYYNRTFIHKDFSGTAYEGSYSRYFRPDYTLSIYPDSCKNESQAISEGKATFIHFDAKYRVESIRDLFGDNFDSDNYDEVENSLNEEKASESVNTYKRGDLLKMHTYNDAIRRTIGSYILYPGDENLATFKVYDELLPGVGAFAIKPSNFHQTRTVLVDFILQVIEHQTNKVSRIAKLQEKENLIIHEKSELGINDFGKKNNEVNYRKTSVSRTSQEIIK